MVESPRDVAAALIEREADLLDRREWDAWLQLYTPDCVFWAPAWRDEDAPVEDPEREVSLMYHDSRESLAERIVRLRSGRTVTAMPLPRTTHLISCVLAREAGAGRIEASASWTTMIYFPRTSAQHALFGRAEHLLEERDGAWRIRRKKAILMNDRVPAAIDFYCL